MAIDINNATKRELTCLFGIGPQAADRIIEYREEHGQIQMIEELLDCDGIEADIILRLRHNGFARQGL